MHKAAQHLVGRHDFTSFRASLCQAQSPVKTLDRLSVERSEEEITILELAKLVIERTGSSSEVQLVPYRDVYVGGFEDMPRRVPDITRARKLVGFEPVTSLAEIVDSMIDDARRRH